MCLEKPTMTATVATAINQPHVMNTYGRVPIALSHGQGCRVWDVNGKSYLDALGGIAVNTLGHNHPKLVPALQDQISKIIHSSNYYFCPNAERVFLFYGVGGQRGGAQAGTQVRP
jgi:acetylornithine/N-succinyldiaminopimelate aminotransferase